MITRKINLLREFVDFICEECHKHEDKCGKLQPHRIKQGGEYSLRNVKMICDKCHSYFTSAQNRAMGISNGK
jgi:Zn finger protein HypA/HybF involved in hydrogenase expression